MVSWAGELEMAARASCSGTTLAPEATLALVRSWDGAWRRVRVAKRASIEQGGQGATSMPAAARGRRAPGRAPLRFPPRARHAPPGAPDRPAGPPVESQEGTTNMLWTSKALPVPLFVSV